MKITIAGADREWTDLFTRSADSPGWMHSGVAIATNGEVVVAAPQGDAMVFIGRDGTEQRRVRTATTDLHGIVRDSQSTEDLFWLVDHGHKYVPADPVYEDWRMPARVLAVTGDGNVVQELSAPDHPAYFDSSWSPTAVAIEGDGDNRRIWVADGYGASLVHVFALDGTCLFTVDGSDSGAAFACPHGIVVDSRGPEPVLVVADRTNKRLVELDLHGRSRRVIGAGDLGSPSGLATDGNLLLVTELWGDLVVFGPDGQVVDRLSVQTAEPARPGWPNAMDDCSMVRPDLQVGVLNSPHGIAVDPEDGSWVLTEWVIGGRVIRLAPRPVTAALAASPV